MIAEEVAKLDYNFLRPAISKMPSWISANFYSRGREIFLDYLLPNENFSGKAKISNEFSRTFWSMDFGNALGNAAGIFKDADKRLYDLTYRMGQGFFLGGTGTLFPRICNSKNFINHPFMPYNNSGAASNWLGLPGKGDFYNSKKVSEWKKHDGFPLGWSVMGNPGLEEGLKLKSLVKSMNLYYSAGADFLEINESCPNTNEELSQSSGLIERLSYVEKNFLNKRKRNFPVVVKFSNDTEIGVVSDLVKILCEKGFDGVNFGNTSTNYSLIRKTISEIDLKNFDYFTKSFGGGVSGKPLKKTSLDLCTEAVKAVECLKPSQEFPVIRTGGIEGIGDVELSGKQGIQLNEWYTGFLKAYAKNGNRVYQEMFLKH